MAREYEVTRAVLGLPLNMDGSEGPRAQATRAFVRNLVPLTALVLFGAAVLHSAAGGSMSPYAWSHLVRFVVFLTMAFVISVVPRELVQKGAYPAYAGILLMLVGVASSVRRQLERTGMLRSLGRENVFLSDPQVGQGLEEAIDAAEAWIAARSNP